MSAKPLGIYVHIPFCIKKCRYCDFCSLPSSEEVKESYVKALQKDIEHNARYFQNYIVDSIYFGGGTPTCLKSSLLISLLESLKSNYNVSDDAEITFECNPATANYIYFLDLISCGFNRISMGLQSVNNNELKELGRIHTFEDFDKTYNDAIKAGFDNINLDLMYGIPLQSEQTYDHSLNTVINYSPKHISAYALKIEPGTDFYKNKQNLILPDEDAEYNMYMNTVNSLSKSGYVHYEISNYSKVKCESKHNLKYWNCDDYIGFGVSAHSCIEKNRYYVISNINEYIKSINSNNKNHIKIEEILSEKEFIEEYIMMRMRLKEGISLSKFIEKFNFGIDKKYIDRILPFIKTGHIKTNGDAYYFTDEGMFLSNYFLTEILDLN